MGVDHHVRLSRQAAQNLPMQELLQEPPAMQPPPPAYTNRDNYTAAVYATRRLRRSNTLTPEPRESASARSRQALEALFDATPVTQQPPRAHTNYADAIYSLRRSRLTMPGPEPGEVEAGLVTPQARARAQNRLQRAQQMQMQTLQDQEQMAYERKKKATNLVLLFTLLGFAGLLWLWITKDEKARGSSRRARLS